MTKHVVVLPLCFSDPDCKIVTDTVCLHLPQEGVCGSMNESKKDFSFPLNNIYLKLDTCKYRSLLRILWHYKY